jgi:hypothetical protein
MRSFVLEIHHEKAGLVRFNFHDDDSGVASELVALNLEECAEVAFIRIWEVDISGTRIVYFRCRDNDEWKNGG